jgi:ribA/ribD-fused uncharacterized protein
MITEFPGLDPFYFWQHLPWTQWTVTPSQFKYTKEVSNFGGFGRPGRVTHTYEFCCTEQWMMWKKAKLMGDHEMARAILDSDDPREIKAMGRKIANFNQALWDSQKLDVVYEGNMLKFTQNRTWGEDLKAKVLNGFFFVESSPYDQVWGIGINTKDATAGKKWRGQNLLGICLTNVAIDLIKKDLQCLYQEECSGLASTAVYAVQAAIKEHCINSNDFVNTDILENAFFDHCLSFFETHYGNGEFRHHH